MIAQTTQARASITFPDRSRSLSKLNSARREKVDSSLKDLNSIPVCEPCVPRGIWTSRRIQQQRVPIPMMSSLDRRTLEFLEEEPAAFRRGDPGRASSGGGGLPQKITRLLFFPLSVLCSAAVCYQVAWAWARRLSRSPSLPAHTTGHARSALHLQQSRQR